MRNIFTQQCQREGSAPPEKGQHESFEWNHLEVFAWLSYHWNHAEDICADEGPIQPSVCCKMGTKNLEINQLRTESPSTPERKLRWKHLHAQIVQWRFGKATLVKPCWAMTSHGMWEAHVGIKVGINCKYRKSLNLELGFEGRQQCKKRDVGFITKVFHWASNIFLTDPCLISVRKWDLITSFSHIWRFSDVNRCLSRVNPWLSILIKYFAVHILIVPPTDWFLDIEIPCKSLIVSHFGIRVTNLEGKHLEIICSCCDIERPLNSEGGCNKQKE